MGRGRKLKGLALPDENDVAVASVWVIRQKNITPGVELDRRAENLGRGK